MILINKGKIAFDGNFDQLRNVMGGFYRILLTTKSEVPPLSLPGMKLLKTQNGVHEYELDRNILEIHKVMELLSGYPQILDMEIKKAPIEDVVANLYLSWRK
jgi:ABC-2 type transport system ATP-binding protein